MSTVLSSWMISITLFGCRIQGYFYGYMLLILVTVKDYQLHAADGNHHPICSVPLPLYWSNTWVSDSFPQYCWEFSAVSFMCFIHKCFWFPFLSLQSWHIWVFTIGSLELLKPWGILRMDGSIWLFSELQLATCAARTWQYDLQGAQMWCPLFLKRPSTIPQQ
jgi:hypothetical protein